MSDKVKVYEIWERGESAPKKVVPFADFEREVEKAFEEGANISSDCNDSNIKQRDIEMYFLDSTTAAMLRKLKDG